MKKIILVSLTAIIFSSCTSPEGDVFSITAPFEEFPNLHPMIVHIPVALLYILLPLHIINWIKSNKAFGWSIVFVAFIAFLGAYFAAYVYHPMLSENATKEIKEIFEFHKHYAYFTMYLSLAIFIVKGVSVAINNKWYSELAVLLLIVGSCYTIAIAGHLGSQMVYLKGVGIQGAFVEEEHVHDAEGEEHDHEAEGEGHDRKSTKEETEKKSSDNHEHDNHNK